MRKIFLTVLILTAVFFLAGYIYLRAFIPDYDNELSIPGLKRMLQSNAIVSAYRP